jgi:hypothetical protein
MRQKQLRIRIACLTVLASLSCSALTFAQEQSNSNPNEPGDSIATDPLFRELLNEPNAASQATGSVGAHLDQRDQSFSEILSFTEKVVATWPVVDFRGAGGPKTNDLYTCGQETSEILPNDDPYFDVTDLAVWISVFSPHFRKEGTYDVAAPFLKRLMEYGEGQTQRVDVYLRTHKPSARGNYPNWKRGEWKDDNEALLTQLAKALNSAIHRKEYTVEGGCGAGEILVSVRIPVGSVALLINTFHFTLCQARGMDAWNAQACYGWKTVGKVPMLLSGAYRYVLTTADGQKKVGDVLINKDSGDMDHPSVLNLK